MLFIDIGNSMIKLVGFSNSRVLRLRKYYQSEKDKEEVKKAIKAFEPQETYITSVNSMGLQLVLDSIDSSSVKVLDVNKKKEYVEKTGFKIPVLDILGADLFCDIIMADKDENTLIVDCGTVTKLLVVKKGNEYVGGTLFPGIASCSVKLTKETDLINIDTHVEVPNKLMSLDTTEAVNIGACFGVASMVYEYYTKVSKEFSNLKLIVTGGSMSTLIDSLKQYGFSLEYEESMELTLLGLSRVYGVEEDLIKLFKSE